MSLVVSNSQSLKRKKRPIQKIKDKAHKSLTERARRQKINNNFNILTQILRNSYCEKIETRKRIKRVEILKKTIGHIEKLQQNNNAMKQRLRQNAESFRAGFKYCVDEVSKLMTLSSNVDMEIAISVMTGLGESFKEIVQPHPIPQTYQVHSMLWRPWK